MIKIKTIEYVWTNSDSNYLQTYHSIDVTLLCMLHDDEISTTFSVPFGSLDVLNEFENKTLFTIRKKVEYSGINDMLAYKYILFYQQNKLIFLNSFKCFGKPLSEK